MENLILAIDNGYALNENYADFEIMQQGFLQHNLSLERVSTMQEALLSLEKQSYLLVIIVEDSVNFMPQLHILRNVQPIPIIIISSLYEAETAIDALEKGADAYIQKPKTVPEIFAICNALIRRYKELNNKEPIRTTIVAHKCYTIFPEQRKLFVNEQEVILTRKEFDLIYLFLVNRGRVLTYEQIFTNVWGDDYLSSSNNALTVLISRLRQKLGTETLDCLRNVHDMGYCFDI